MRNARSWGLMAAGAAAMLGFAGSAQATPSLCDAIADNLVKNCGFELATGSGPAAFPDWMATPAASGTDFGVDGFDPNSGNNQAFFAGIAGFDTISQTLTTTPGTAYDFSFFLANTDEGFAPANEFKASLDGGVLFDAVNASDYFGYKEETFTFVGTGSDTISFAAYNGPEAFFLDDVSVVPAVPEPASLTLFGSALAGFGVVRRGRRRCLIRKS